MQKLIATISTGKSSAGLWINELLYSALRKQGASGDDEDIDGIIFVRVSNIDGDGILLDTYQGDTPIKFNMSDVTHPERFARGRINAESNFEMIKFGGLYYPTTRLVQCVEYGKFLIPHPK